MTLPASLLGFGLFRTLSKHLDFPFSPVENVLVQTVAGSMALMPLGCGFVGVVCPPSSQQRRRKKTKHPTPGLTSAFAKALLTATVAGYELLALARRDGAYTDEHLEAHRMVSWPLLLWRRFCSAFVRAPTH